MSHKCKYWAALENDQNKSVEFDSGDGEHRCREEVKLYLLKL